MSPDPLPETDDNLQISLKALAQLSTGQLQLEDCLTRVAQLAVSAIPGAAGAGLTLLENGRADTIVATADFVAEVDAIQYSLGQGPCITAAATAKTVHSGSLGGEPRWPKFGSQVARLGVHSVLSLPLVTPEQVLGAMNIYAREKRVFDERAQRVGELFAAPAAIAVQNAQVLAQARRLATDLQAALVSRSVVDRAVGIMMSRSGGTETEAMERLRRMSQNERRRLSDVASSLVDEAVRRANAHHRDLT
jgi:GAF domain-containing protein